jgi:recombination protein RecT
MAAGTQESVKGKLAGKGAVVKQGDKPRTMEDEIKGFMQKYAGLLPEHIKPERMQRIIFNEYRTVPRLKECSPGSFYGAVIKAVQLGLEPGVLGHAYLLPFKNSRTNSYEVQLIIGYKGMIELIRRSGQILEIVARPVYEGDTLEISYGIDTVFKHVPYFMVDGAVKGDLKGVTLDVKFKDGGRLIDYMPRTEIDEHRQRSLAKDSGPWKTDYEAMALKTIIRKNFKWLPVSIEYQRAIGETDERVNTVREDGNAITVDYDIVDPSTGEVIEEAKPSPVTKEPQKAEEAPSGDPLFAS